MCKVYGDGAVEILFAPLEESMLANLQKDIQVSRGSAIRSRLSFVCQTDAGTFVYAGRNRDLQLSVHLPVSLPTTLAARGANDLSGSIARAAGPPDGEETLLVQYLASAMTSGQVVA